MAQARTGCRSWRGSRPLVCRTRKLSWVEFSLLTLQAMRFTFRMEQVRKRISTCFYLFVAFLSDAANDSTRTHHRCITEPGPDNYHRVVPGCTGRLFFFFRGGTLVCKAVTSNGGLPPRNPAPVSCVLISPRGANLKQLDLHSTLLRAP